MLNKYLPEDICNIIRHKLSLDYKKYRIWCCTEVKWIYIWTEYDLDTITCPNEKNHEIYSDFIRVINRIQSNGRILRLDKIKTFKCDIIQTDFKILHI